MALLLAFIREGAPGIGIGSLSPILSAWLVAESGACCWSIPLIITSSEHTCSLTRAW